MVSKAWLTAITCSYFIAGIVPFIIGISVAVASLFLAIGFVLAVVVMSICLSSKNAKIQYHKRGC